MTLKIKVVHRQKSELTEAKIFPHIVKINDGWEKCYGALVLVSGYNKIGNIMGTFLTTVLDTNCYDVGYYSDNLCNQKCVDPFIGEIIFTSEKD